MGAGHSDVALEACAPAFFRPGSDCSSGVVLFGRAQKTTAQPTFL